MKKFSTLFKLVFFGLLLAGLIFIQYNWVNSLQKGKLQAFKSGLISAINTATEKLPPNETPLRLTNATFVEMLHQAFSSDGFGNISFEYAYGSGENHFISPGFNKQQSNKASNLVLQFSLPQNRVGNSTGELLTVVVPLWKQKVLKETGWVIAASVFLTLMVLVIFCCASFWGGRRQQLLYDNRAHSIKNMLQHLETPLSTMSVAAEALRNARVMSDTIKINYYQQIIHEENQRMHEQVKKLLRDLQ